MGQANSAEVWKAALLATSATAMVWNLLLGTFDLETLLKNNLNGGKPTRGDGEQLVALDQIKKASLLCLIIFVFSRCYIEEVAVSQPRGVTYACPYHNPSATMGHSIHNVHISANCSPT
ncbi:hypothetical protein F2P79_014942 [Pimephales promelas]|nr:hypothetical protein F2P79_014942 [Pimephales promelas]